MTDCQEFGHLWTEENGEPFVRHQARPKGLVPVMCCVCGTTTELEGYAAHTRAYQIGPAQMGA